MSTRSTIAASDRTHESRDIAVAWHIYRDYMDHEPDDVWLELRGVRAAAVHASDAHPILVEVRLGDADLWDLIRGAGEARARGEQNTPPLFAIRYDQPPDAAGRVRVERVDVHVRRHPDPEWEEMARAAQQAPVVPVEPPSDAAAVRGQPAVEALAGRYARLQRTVIDAWQGALVRREDALHVLLAHSGVNATDIASLAAALRICWGNDERRVWEWLLEATPLALGGATPHEALRQGRIADVDIIVRQSIGGAYS